MGPAGEPIEAVFREERGRLLALLAARFGDLDLAEEVTAEALLAAVETWPRSGVPRRPLAWLATTARRKALDRIRRDATLAAKLATLHADADPARRAQPVPEYEHIPDDRLQLIFACCHPALDLDTQTGLTLRYVAGLSTAQIAQAFLIPPATMAQRLTRGKRKIQHSRIPFRVPGPDELEGRLGLVLHVVYLIFTEGYAATGHHDLVRCDLVDEAIRLARILHQLMPGEPQVTGLLALMLLTDARRPARVDGHGIAVSLEDQDRGRWDTSMIDEGTRLATQALTHHPPNSWSVQAAIAALHDEAPSAQETDWHQVRLLYDELFALTPTPVVALNRAIAISWHEGPQAEQVRIGCDSRDCREGRKPSRRPSSPRPFTYCRSVRDNQHGKGSVARPLPSGGLNGAPPFQRRFSAISALAVTIGSSLGPRGEVVIVVFDDRPKEMEITLVNCQADEPDEAACHHVP